MRGLACRDVRRGNPPRSQATPTVQRLQTWRNRMRIAGRWRITEAELWDCDALNLVAPAFIEFAEDGSSGSFGFIAVQGEMDCRDVERDGRPGVEFSWEGNDECDPASGRGWAMLEEDGSLRGRIFFHLGDDSGFTAVREVTEGRF